MSNNNGTLAMVANLTFGERLAAGKYFWKPDDFHSLNFSERIVKDYKARYKIFYFDKSIGSKNAIRAMNAKGFRPGNVNELLKLGEIYNHPSDIVALGSTWLNKCNKKEVPALMVGTSGRKLFLLYFDSSYGWGSGWGFLAVK